MSDRDSPIPTALASALSHPLKRTEVFSGGAGVGAEVGGIVEINSAQGNPAGSNRH